MEKSHGILIILFYVSLFSLLKAQKSNHSSASDRGNTLNLVLKRMLEHLLKIQTLKEILEFQEWKKVTKPIKKENFKLEIKLII